jgi:hypothetical protein
MNSPLLRTLLGLAAGAVGFYLGLFVLLAATGLERPGWAPVTMVAGAGLLGGAVAAGLAGLGFREVAVLASGAAASGAVLGALVSGLRDGFEWSIVAAALVVIGGSIAASRLSGTTGTERHSPT